MLKVAVRKPAVVYYSIRIHILRKNLTILQEKIKDISCFTNYGLEDMDELKEKIKKTKFKIERLIKKIYGIWYYTIAYNEILILKKIQEAIYMVSWIFS